MHIQKNGRCTPKWLAGPEFICSPEIMWPVDKSNDEGSMSKVVKRLKKKKVTFDITEEKKDQDASVNVIEN